MAVQRELNARERKQVYMHSTIFDDGGPTSKSIYRQDQQGDLHRGLGDSLKPRGAPSMELASAADIRCTQNAGHGVVIPGNVGVDRRDGPGQLQTTRSTPRSSGPEVLVVDGDRMPILKAGGKDTQTPQEFWQTSVKVEWHDPRNEASRQNKNRNQDLGAKELKLQEMSSEIFGKPRHKNPSTENPGAELLSTETDYLQVDSALNRNFRNERLDQGGQGASAYDRFTQNLGSSQQNTMSQLDPDLAAAAPMVLEEDPSSFSRRRQEKNFSDLFGTQMGERKDIKGREEVLSTQTCSFLDTRSEIAVRNKSNWRPGQSDVEGTDLQERPCVSTLRKEAERDSNLFDRTAPQKPRANTEEVEINGNERVCFDTRDIMQPQAEIARRHRLKEFEANNTAQDRMWNNTASQQVRRGLGGEYDESRPQFSPRGGYPRKDRLTDPPANRPNRACRAPPAAGDNWSGDRPSSAKDKKLAFLQSSIFG